MGRSTGDNDYGDDDDDYLSDQEPIRIDTPTVFGGQLPVMTQMPMTAPPHSIAKEGTQEKRQPQQHLLFSAEDLAKIHPLDRGDESFARQPSPLQDTADEEVDKQQRQTMLNMFWQMGDQNRQADDSDSD